jgi:hypothetical protein
MAGCYTPTSNTITLPAMTSDATIKHEMIHHICNHNAELNCQADETQQKHKSPLFSKCAGLSLLD